MTLQFWLTPKYMNLPSGIFTLKNPPKKHLQPLEPGTAIALLPI